MMKLGFALLLIFGLAAAAYRLTPQDAEKFLLGIGEGLEIDFSQNISVCIADENATFVDFEDSFANLDNGFKTKNLEEIKQGLIDFGEGCAEIGRVLRACGITQMGDDIFNIAEQIQEGKIFEVVIHEVVNILHHGISLYDEFRAAVAAWKGGDYFTSGVNVGEILGILLQD